MANRDEHTLYLLKFKNNDQMLSDECGNYWKIGKFYTEDSLRPFVSTSDRLLLNPSLVVSGTNYIETDSYKLDLNSKQWTIDFWIFLPKGNIPLTYLSIRGDIIIVGSTKVYIKTEDGQTHTIQNRCFTDKWFHFALVKHNAFISTYVNGVRIGFTRIYSQIKSDSDFPHIISLGKSVSSVGYRTQYNIVQFRISDIERFAIDETFNPYSTLAYLNDTKISIKRNFRKYFDSFYSNINLYKSFGDICKNILNNIKIWNDTKRKIKSNYSTILFDIERKLLYNNITKNDTLLNSDAIDITSIYRNICITVKEKFELERTIKRSGYHYYYEKYVKDPVSPKELEKRIEIYRNITYIADTSRYISRIMEAHNSTSSLVHFRIIRITDYDRKFEYYPLSKLRNFRMIYIIAKSDVTRKVYQVEKVVIKRFELMLTDYDNLYYRVDDDDIAKLDKYYMITVSLNVDCVRSLYYEKELSEEDLITLPFRPRLTEYDKNYVFISDFNDIEKYIFHLKVKSNTRRKVYQEIKIIDVEYKPREIKKTEYDNKYIFQPIDENSTLLIPIYSEIRVIRKIIDQLIYSSRKPVYRVRISAYDERYFHNPLRLKSRSKYFTIKTKNDLKRKVYQEIYVPPIKDLDSIIRRTEYDDNYIFSPFNNISTFITYIHTKFDINRDIKESIYSSRKPVYRVRISAYDERYFHNPLRSKSRSKYFTIKTKNDLKRKVYQEIYVPPIKDLDSIIRRTEYDQLYIYDPFNGESNYIYIHTKFDINRDIKESIYFSRKPVYRVRISAYDERYFHNPTKKIPDYFTMKFKNDLLRKVYMMKKVYYDYYTNPPDQIPNDPPRMYDDDGNLIGYSKPKVNKTEYDDSYYFTPSNNPPYIIYIEIAYDSCRRVNKGIIENYNKEENDDILNSNNSFNPLSSSNNNDSYEIDNTLMMNKPFGSSLYDYNYSYDNDTILKRIIYIISIQEEFDTCRKVEIDFTCLNGNYKSLKINSKSSLLETDYDYLYKYNPIDIYTFGEIYLTTIYDTYRKVIDNGIKEDTQTTPRIKLTEYDSKYSYKPINNYIFSEIYLTTIYDSCRIVESDTNDAFSLLKNETPVSNNYNVIINLAEEFETNRILRYIDDYYIDKTIYDNNYYFDDTNDIPLTSEIYLTTIYDTYRKVIDNGIKEDTQTTPRIKLTEYDSKYKIQENKIKELILLYISEDFETKRIVISTKSENENKFNTIPKTQYDDMYDYDPLSKLLRSEIYLTTIYDTCRIVNPQIEYILPKEIEVIGEITTTIDTLRVIDNSYKISQVESIQKKFVYIELLFDCIRKVNIIDNLGYDILIHLAEEFDTRRIIQNDYPIEDEPEYDNNFDDIPLTSEIYLTTIYDTSREII